MIPEKPLDVDAKLYQDLMKICPKLRGSNISDDSIYEFAKELQIQKVKGSVPTLQHIRRTRQVERRDPDERILNLLSKFCHEPKGRKVEYGAVEQQVKRGQKRVAQGEPEGAPKSKVASSAVPVAPPPPFQFQAPPPAPMPPLAPPPPFMGPKIQAGAGVPPAPPMPRAPDAPPAPPMMPRAPAAPFAPPAPPHMPERPIGGVKRPKEPEVQQQVEEQSKRLKFDRLFEDKVEEVVPAPYEFEEFAPDQVGGAVNLERRLEEVSDICDGMIRVGLMPTDFASQTMEQLEGLAIAMANEAPDLDGKVGEMKEVASQYYQAMEHMNVARAASAVDVLLGIPTDGQIQSEINRIKDPNVSIDERRAFLNQLDKTTWTEPQIKLCSQLTNVNPPMGKIKFNNEFSKLINGLGQSLIEGVKKQSIIQEDQRLMLTEPLNEETREEVEVDRVRTTLDIGKRAILRSKLRIDEMQLTSVVDSFAKAFVADCHNLKSNIMPRFIGPNDLNMEEIEKFLIDGGVDPNNIDEIVSILTDVLRQQYTDSIRKIVADEKTNPQSQLNKIANESFKDAIDKLSLIAENIQTRGVKEFINHMGIEFQKSVNNLSDNVDNVKEGLLQVKRAGKYKLVEERPFAAGAFGSVYKLTLKAGGDNKPTNVLKILGASIPKKEWDRYHQEGELVAKRVNHPNVISLDDVLLDDRGAIIGLIGPYMPDGDLSYIENLDSPISEERAIGYLAQMASGIQALHDNDVAHLDLNLGNFLMDGDHLSVMDFGTSRVVGVRGEVRVEPGKRKYSAPEEEQGVATIKSDCFSFGMLMYQMLEGRPFDRGGNIVFRNVKDEKLKELISGFLQPVPNNRPPVSAFLQYLGER